MAIATTPDQWTLRERLRGRGCQSLVELQGKLALLQIIETFEVNKQLIRSKRSHSSVFNEQSTSWRHDRHRNRGCGGSNMRRSTKAIIGGFCAGAVLLYGWHWYYGRRRIRNFHLTNDDLNYSDRSAEELVTDRLIDLNSASAAQLTDLGLSAESQDRLIENRPYRTKLELVSRMILSQDEYAAIKAKVSIADANESVKIA